MDCQHILFKNQQTPETHTYNIYEKIKKNKKQIIFTFQVDKTGLLY